VEADIKGFYFRDALARPVDEPQSHCAQAKIPTLCNVWRPGTVNVTTLAITAARAMAVSMTEARSMAGKIHAHGLGPVNDDRGTVSAPRWASGARTGRHVG
jgi:hypothetical protein